MNITYGTYKQEAEKASEMIHNILDAVGINETGNINEDVMTAIAVIRNMKKTTEILADDAGLAIMQQVD
jgi:hypothetical protein